MDNRIVMTLDAGGTKFNFSAIQDQEEIIKAVILPAQAKDLESILKTIIEGFEQVKSRLNHQPVAISFSFPGPADYENGIIGDLENLPQFKHGVALKAMLEYKFGIPVYINNDGDLFAYGEAIGGFLPYINNKLKENKNPRQYKNLLGVTFGTGFGGGIISGGKLFRGDNSSAGEINRSRNKLYPLTSVEDSVSIRGLKRVFAREAGLKAGESPDPKELFDIAMGKTEGNKNAALTAFEELSIVAGDCIASAITLVDGLVVIGGGLSGAHPVFMENLVEEMNRNFHSLDDKKLDRLELKAFNLEDPEDLSEFLDDSSREIQVPFSNKKVTYDPVKRIGVGISHLGTSKAAAIGAWAFALDQLDKPEG